MRAMLEMRARQQITLTPHLQQSVRLLQLSSVEFEQEISQALASNPFLEEDEATDAGAILQQNGPGLADAALEAIATAVPEIAADPATDFDGLDYETEATAADRSDWETSEPYGNEPGNHGKPDSHAADESSDLAGWVSALPSLHEQLHSDLDYYRLTPREYSIAELIIEALDEDGYLREQFADLLQMFPGTPPLTEAEFDAALKLVQQLDPPGIAARSIAECLALQLQAMPADTGGRDLAMRIVEKHLAALARHKHKELQALLDCSSAQLQSALALIRTLDPHPGARFVRHRASYIVPDVIVQKVRNKWVAAINPAVLPRARLHSAYAEMFQQARNNDRSAMAQQLQEARWLIRNAQQRFHTIQRVASAIVARQRNFFEYGDIAIKPLMLGDVADELGLHESTISRATSNKYMTTPRGIFEFKHFFSRQLATESGGSCSAAAVRALIREFIAAEDSKAPLSDVALTKLLAQQGIVVARRTITKYRGLMKVPPVELRRQT